MDDDRKFPVWAGPVLGLVIVVALVVIGLIRGPVEFDPTSPEGTVQLYIEAIVEGDYATAASFWHQNGCLPASNVPTREQDVSATLINVDGNDIEAIVEVRITEISGDPLGGVSEFHEWFNLVREGDDWRIRQPSWPYYDQPCEESA